MSIQSTNDLGEPTHRLGASIQNMGPLDGSGGVHSSLAVLCWSCGQKFMVVVSAVPEASGYDRTSPDRQLFCPYCGVKAPAVASRGRLSDHRQWGDD